MKSIFASVLIVMVSYAVATKHRGYPPPSEVSAIEVSNGIVDVDDDDYHSTTSGPTSPAHLWSRTMSGDRAYWGNEPSETDEYGFPSFTSSTLNAFTEGVPYHPSPYYRMKLQNKARIRDLCDAVGRCYKKYVQPVEKKVQSAVEPHVARVYDGLYRDIDQLARLTQRRNKFHIMD
jgi:hypothetical protein